MLLLPPPFSFACVLVGAGAEPEPVFEAKLLSDGFMVAAVVVE